MKYSLLLVAACILMPGCVASVKKGAEMMPSSARNESAPDESRDQCLRAIRRARLDARSGSYRMYVYAKDRYDPGFARYLAEHMKSRYGIELIIYGPEDREREKCYSNEMDKIILNTFGADILAQAEEEARALLESHKK